MNRSIRILVLSILILPMILLTVGCLGLLPHSVFAVTVKSSGVPGKSGEIVSLTTGSTLPPDYSTPTSGPTLPPDIPTSTPVLPLREDYALTETAPTPYPSPTVDPQYEVYGQVYFSLWERNAYRMVRLPGVCLVGLQVCPEPETLHTPFDIHDVFNTSDAGMPWSLNGRYAAVTIHPKDELLEGWTREELKQLEQKSPDDFTMNPSTLYIYDALMNTWREIFRADRKYIYLGSWSPDGQWLSFTMFSSLLASHSVQDDDGIYIIHPDGTGLRQLLNKNRATPLGWIGSSLIVDETLPSKPSWNFRIEILSLDGQLKPLFESNRLAFYYLDPNGGSLLATDSAVIDAPTPQKAVDLVALDGSVIHSYGVYNNWTSPISAGTWSSDGSQIAFASQRRVYVAPRNGMPREVYTADDHFVDDPSITNIQFSPDQKYLLMQVYDGRVKLVSVSLENGQATPLQWPYNNDLQQPGNFSWQP